MAKTIFSSLHYLPFFLLSILTINSNAQNDQKINLRSSLIASGSSSSSSWQSPSGEFAFGFRQIDNQKYLFLLAIWFEKIPDKTIVWYANGDNPAPKGSKIELTSDGQFILSDPKGQSLWEADISSQIADYAMLLDTGNLVLGTNGNSSYIWKSFDHPTDTLLPSQVLEVDEVLFSRETNKNYSKGRFELRLVPEGYVELNTLQLPAVPASTYYNSAKTADNSNGMNSVYKLVFNETGLLYVLARNGTRANFKTGYIGSTRNLYYRATLDSDGIFAQYAHAKSPQDGSNSGESWFSVWHVPDDICFAQTGEVGLGACGYNSFCALDPFGRPTCGCLPGFSLVDPDNQYSGCKQDKVHKCEVQGSDPNEVYDMGSVSNTFWPTSANYEVFPYQNEEECSTSCLSDCNCVVVVIKQGLCYKKKMPLSNGRVDRDTYGKALVKIPKRDGSEGDRVTRNQDSCKKDQQTLVLVVSSLLGGSMLVNLLFIGGISLAFFFVNQKRQKFYTGSSLLETNLRLFTYEELKEATNGFKEEVGRGAFGTVYKGVLFTSSSSPSRKIVAVKKLERLAQESEKEFKTELSAIATTHHKNLVRLVGFCIEGTQRLLVYEFMSNGTLANFAFGISRPDWNKRIQMALGITRGLVYLHEECSTQIIHCDIKPQNILLDDTYTAKISDFGLAKLLLGDQTRTNTGIRGTKGYVAPEWFRSTPVTAKVDVYSYGVLLLEIVCCRKNVEMERENEEEIILTDWVYDCYKSRRIEKVVEDDDEARTDLKRVERLIMVAIWCIQEDPSVRPSMKKVLHMLEGVVEVSIPPCPSPYTSIC